jgi:tetratricopeptide (TPR) repeat protein
MERPMGRHRGFRAAVILLAIVVGGLSWCGWRSWDVRRAQDEMARIEAAMQEGRYATAARDLSNLLARRRDSDRAAYLLGVCEKARGRPREADAAWARVPLDAPFGARAVTARMDIRLEQGRLADAEELIERAALGRGREGSALRVLLIPTLIQEGRRPEAERLIESRWRSLNAKGEGASEQAINLARLHIELRWEVPPVDAVRAYLDQVGRLATDDDRIWLGKANLAIRTGSYDEAAQWIDACLGRRPLDPTVWRARLDWAMRSNRLADARTALKHLPATPATAAEVHRMSAALAAMCNDFERERRELAALIALAPEDFEAQERLETLERRGGAKTFAAGLRQRSAAIERDQVRYRELYRRNQPARDAEEMARLAERLGHPFEAIVFLTAALADEPDRYDVRGPRPSRKGRPRSGRRGPNLVRPASDGLPWRQAAPRMTVSSPEPPGSDAHDLGERSTGSPASRITWTPARRPSSPPAAKFGRPVSWLPWLRTPPPRPWLPDGQQWRSRPALPGYLGWSRRRRSR